MMKMTPDEFQAMRKKLQESADEVFAQGQSELSAIVIEYLEGVQEQIINDPANYMKSSDFIYFTSNFINSMKSYLI